jgi:hypothetical protein
MEWGMQMDIKPIETIYNGYRFRSRLEARWAVFFDALGAKYEYEPEGFYITKSYGDHSGMYLPDFYLPDFDVYAEVKGSDEQLKIDSAKIGDAIDYKNTPMSQKGLILLGPIPYQEYSIPYFDILYWHKGVCSTKCLFDIGPAFEHGEFYNERSESEYWCFYGITDNVDYGAPLPSKVSVNAQYQHFENTTFCEFRILNECYKKARQSRFEHGEKPTF